MGFELQEHCDRLKNKKGQIRPFGQPTGHGRVAYKARAMTFPAPVLMVCEKRSALESAVAGKHKISKVAF